MRALVFVSDWQRERRVQVETEQVIFQVTLTCGHCDICSARVRRVVESLQASGMEWRWVSPPAGWPEGVRCVSIPRLEGIEPMEQLRRALGLGIQQLVAA